MEAVIALFLAHLVGNHLFKNNYIILNKSSFKKIGWKVCIIHSLIYTATVVLFVREFSAVFILSVFAIHFAIDKFNLGEIWLELTGNYSLTKFMRDQNKTKNINKDNYIISVMNSGQIAAARDIYFDDVMGAGKIRICNHLGYKLANSLLTL